MLRRKMNSFLLRLRYLKLLAEIKVLIGLSGVRRESGFQKGKTFVRTGAGEVLSPLTTVMSRKKLYTFCHSGLDPESSVFGLDSRFRGNDNDRKRLWDYLNLKRKNHNEL